MLVPLPSLLAQARSGGYAVGYFEAWDGYSLESVVEAAEAEHSPVILGFGCMMVDRAWLDGGAIRLLGCLGRTMAERTPIPVSLLLNEAKTYEETLAGIEAGFNAVMLDTSAWPWDQALDRVAELVRAAHAVGVAVEAELGHLPDAIAGGVDSSDAELTDPEQAAEFVERTGVDCLAVSIGNTHLLLEGEATIDMVRLAAIHDGVGVPLVIHGGSGFPPSAVPDAIRLGAAKFNVGTILKKAFLDGMRASVAGLPADVNVHDVLGSHSGADVQHAGKERMCAAIRQYMRMYGSSGRATVAQGGRGTATVRAVKGRRDGEPGDGEHR
jgi:ketose-bisphosphate aldolase